MKKIALLHYAYPPSMGGVEVLMKEQAETLAELGYAVMVLTGAGEEDNPKIQLVIDPHFRSVLQQDPQLQKQIVEEGLVGDDFYHLSEKIYDSLKQHLIDREVIIIHNMATLVHNLPFLQAVKRYASEHQEKKVIVWVHDQTFIDEEKIQFNKEGVNLSEEQKKLLMTPIQNAQYVVISATLGKLLVKVMDIDPKDLVIIPNGINLQRFFDLDQSTFTVLDQENVFTSYPLLFSPVNILQRKNLLYSLEVVAQLKKKYPQIKYIISGKPSVHRTSNDYYLALKKKVAELGLDATVVFMREKLPGTLDQRTVKALYSLADGILYLSTSENFGLVILEAALLKTPIFVSQLAVFSEIGGNELCYIDYTVLSPQQAANVIAETLEKSSVSRLHARVRAEYDLKKITTTYLVPLLS